MNEQPIIDWPFADLIISEYDIRILLPPCPRLIIFYEISGYLVAVSKSALNVASVSKITPHKSIQPNGIETQWVALKKQPLSNLVRRLNRPIATTRIEL
jgi:hypothetical protein